MFQGTDVARIKRADDLTDAPLAWFRVVYADASNDVVVVHVYRHAEAVSDRPWLAACATFAAAVEYCDQLDAEAVPAGSYDWSKGSTETSPGEPEDIKRDKTS